MSLIIICPNSVAYAKVRAVKCDKGVYPSLFREESSQLLVSCCYQLQVSRKFLRSEDLEIDILDPVFMYFPCVCLFVYKPTMSSNSVPKLSAWNSNLTKVRARGSLPAADPSNSHSCMHAYMRVSCGYQVYIVPRVLM
jgi:hypothetical protein